tara:strand:+ start:3601 stop:5262 length:1662 start_codon:yes stop_codon:yes gene_type:complete
MGRVFYINRDIMEIFGFEIKRRFNKGEISEPPEKNTVKSFVPPVADEGVSTIAAGGYYGQYYDIDGTGGNSSDRDMIIKYRQAAEQPEADNAIDDIVNEAIAAGDIGSLVSLNVDDLEYEMDVKRKILNEFDTVYNLFNFTEYGSDYFRKFYIDGKIYFHIVVDSANPKAGIQDLRYIDPINMKKVREVKKEVDKLTGVTIEETAEEYYVYSETDLNAHTNTNNADNISGVKVANEAIVYVTSGIMDSSRSKVLSHLHKSIKIINQLRMLEDALVIYRISRAPERRIFYIDVGNLPKGKAEEYVRNMMSQYRNKIVYDASSGEVRDDRRHKSMLEDFFLPRREGGRGTEITTLPGGENLGQIDDILFFQKKLYKSLNVPLSRLESETGFQVGRATEINREEVKFHKFISRLRQRFSHIFLNALKTQLILKGIINEDDWPMISENIYVDYQKDNYFAELKEFEIMRDRFEVMSQLEPYIEQGYYSKEWARRNILGQDDQEIEMIDKQLADEKAEGENEEEFNDLMAGKDPNIEKGALESDLDSQNGNLEKEIGS